MLSVSAAFTSALSASHTVASRADVCTTAGQVLATLDVVGGSVTADETAAVRRTCSATIIDRAGTLVPYTAGDLLHPASGNELRLYRGVRYADGTEETVPLGVFRLSRPRISDSVDGLTIDVQGYDRAKRIQRSRWVDPYMIPSGTNVATAVQALLDDRWGPGLTYSLMTTTRTTPAVTFGVERDNDPWKDAQSLAAAIGAELFFGPAGQVVMRPIPDAATSPPVASFVEGAGSTMVSVTRDLDEDRTYNGVIVVGEGTGTPVPVRYDAWDANPYSPTYYLGPYGKVPYFLTSSLITTQAQAQEAAEGQLRRVLGTFEQVTVEAIPQPALEPGDVVRITRARSVIDGLNVIARTTCPLGPDGTMQVSCRQQRPAS